MRNIASIYMIISFFIYIILTSVIFIVIRNIFDNKLERNIQNIKNKEFGKEVIKQLNLIKNNKQITKIDIDYINQKLKSKTYARAFNEIIIEFNKIDKNNEVTKKYMGNFEDYIENLLKKSSRKEDTFKSYVALVLGEYRISNYVISEYLLKCLETKSTYLRVAALRSISKIGNAKNFIKAIEYISIKNSYIHEKILSDIFSEFKGNKMVLIKELFVRFDQFNETIQCVIINSLKANNNEFIKKVLLKKLKGNEIEKETRISIIKYFESVTCSEANEEIINILKKYEWEYRVVASKALKNYKNEKSISALLESISDKNWYVRYNSAISLLSFNENYIIEKVLKKKDRYAKEILLYVIADKKRLNLDIYKK